ncbi:hypothetical protein GCM10022252_12910 [Streptosporangium oxazolinicum]|uniref:Uncharacterized protein n=1 Tax=Streptosporangium oxazolinicum TaxID=909287 RepID=A0ABP8AI32_9ACTN
MGTSDVGILWLDAVTRDGVTITVNAAARAFVADPPACASYPGSPGAAKLAAAEAEIRRYVGKRDLSQLPRRVDPVRGHGDGTRHWGVEVVLVAIARVEVRRREDLIRWAERLAS